MFSRNSHHLIQRLKNILHKKHHLFRYSLRRLRAASITRRRSAFPASTAERVSKWVATKKTVAGLVSDDHRQGGLAGAGRFPQEDGWKEAVGFDGAAQQLAGGEGYRPTALACCPTNSSRVRGRIRAARGASARMRVSWAWEKRSIIRFLSGRAGASLLLSVQQPICVNNPNPDAQPGLWAPPKYPATGGRRFRRPGDTIRAWPG